MRLRVTVDGKAYEVEVEVADADPPGAVRYVGSGRTGAPAPPAPAAEGRAPGGRVDAGPACRSPLAGVVAELAVAPGDTVATDQPVAVLEAMKMFTTITSPIDGKVASVPVAVGDAVKPGQVLVAFEEEAGG